jgi:putative RecB family exonuclease
MAKNIKLSATRIGTFLRCKQKYWFMYHDKLPKVENDAFKLGIAVHESLEEAGKIILEKGKLTDADKKKVLKVYDQVSIKEGLSDMGLHKEGKTLVKKRLSDFLSGKKLVGLETKFGFWGRDGGETITTKDGVPLMGAIDKAEEYDKSTLLIVDYKTSKTVPTPDQLREDIQLSIYDLAARQIWPGYKRIILSLDMLKHEPVYTYRTDAEREEFEDYLKTIYDAMLNLDESEVKASLNMFCPWCDYRDYCQTYQKACSKANYKFLPVMNLTSEQLVEEWQSVKATKKILESRERELGMVLMEKIRKDSKNVVGDEQEVYIRQNSKTNYDLETVFNAVPPEDFATLVNLNKRAVESYLNINPRVKETIVDSVTVNHTAPFLATKKIKKKKGDGNG